MRVSPFAPLKKERKEANILSKRLNSNIDRLIPIFPLLLVQLITRATVKLTPDDSPSFKRID
jgi:hypothetical protein